MKKVFAALIVTITMLFFMKTVMAEGPDLKPGKWEFTTTVTMPMMPEAKVTTNTVCITADQASDPLAAMIEDGACNVLRKEENGNTIEVEVECEGDMDMKMKGNGSFTANGATASGKMEMTINIPQMGGQSMMMTQEWEGKRVGDCD